MGYYVYEDWTLEVQPRCFYVGKGRQRRVDDLKRNQKHANIANKLGQNRVVVFETHDQTRAFSLEIKLIAERKTFYLDSPTGIGCNFTRGGEGVSAPSYRKGKKLPLEHCQNISKGKKGKPTHWSRPKSEAFKAFMSKTLTGIKRSKETRKKTSQGLIGNSNHSKPPKNVKAIRDCCNGIRETAYGFKWSWTWSWT